MADFAGSTESAYGSWSRKAPKRPVTDVLIDLVQQFALPVAIGGFLLRRFLGMRKARASKKPDAKANASKAEDPAIAEHHPLHRKPRREYKVKRDQEGPLLVGADDDDETPEVQPHDNVMEAYDETETEQAGAVATGPGGGNTAMLQMLQQMGYRIIMPKDGSGQVFLVPPGAKGPGGQAIEEGDEEGYDEDEEGDEEGEEGDEEGEDE